MAVQERIDMLTNEQIDELSKLAPVFLSELDTWEQETELARSGIRIPAEWFEPVKVMCQNLEAINKDYPRQCVYSTEISEDNGKLKVELSLVTWPQSDEVMNDIAERIDKELTTAELACRKLSDKNKEDNKNA